MRFATIETWAGPRAALRRDGVYVDLHATDGNLPPSVRGILAGGERAIAAAQRAADKPDAVTYPVAEVKLHAPIVDPRKIVCLGLNYRDHAAESGAPIPKEPILFSKYPTALIGHGEAIVLPRVSKEVDYEAELVIVVGKKGRHICCRVRRWRTSRATPSGTMSRPATGSSRRTASSGWSARRSTPSRRWARNSSPPTRCPNPNALPIRLRLNGTTMQDSNTKQMIFSVAQTLAYLSQVFTLEPGDLIFTGTPPGVGFARKPPVFLKGGDVVEVEIEGLGVLRNPVVEE